MCFVAGTLILTAAGLRAIESIRAGDRVLATDPESGITEEKVVVETYVRETGQLVHLWVGGELISTTPNHPFWVRGRGFVSAGELQAGEKLVNAAGEGCRIENIRREIVERQERVYNFQVEGFHTYHVGSIGVLVHNTDCGGEGGSEPGIWEKTNEAMSEASKNYQRFITGADEGMVYRVNGVKFDGYANGVLMEAKGNYSNFVNKFTGKFKAWFSGKDCLVNQANRQLNAANGIKIQWYFNDEMSLNAVKDLFVNEGIIDIDLILKPMQ